MGKRGRNYLEPNSGCDEIVHFWDSYVLRSWLSGPDNILHLCHLPHDNW